MHRHVPYRVVRDDAGPRAARDSRATPRKNRVPEHLVRFAVLGTRDADGLIPVPPEDVPFDTVVRRAMGSAARGPRCDVHSLSIAVPDTVVADGGVEDRVGVDAVLVNVVDPEVLDGDIAGERRPQDVVHLAGREVRECGFVAVEPHIRHADVLNLARCLVVRVLVVVVGGEDVDVLLVLYDVGAVSLPDVFDTRFEFDSGRLTPHRGTPIL